MMGTGICRPKIFRGHRRHPTSRWLVSSLRTPRRLTRTSSNELGWYAPPRYALSQDFHIGGFPSRSVPSVWNSGSNRFHFMPHFGRIARGRSNRARIFRKQNARWSPLRKSADFTPPWQHRRRGGLRGNHPEAVRSRSFSSPCNQTKGPTIASASRSNVR